MSAVLLGRLYFGSRIVATASFCRTRFLSSASVNPSGTYQSTEPGNRSRIRKETSSNSNYERIPLEEKEDDVVASEILTAALNHVNTRGWNEEAIKAGARDVFMSEEISGIFREYDLVKFFISSCNKDLEAYLSKSEPSLSVLEALEYRLEKVVPYAPKFRQALAHATKPENFAESLRLLLDLSDSIAHHSLKDRSTDVSWYTKRMGIASIYVASELCFVQDTSENYKDTFAFLARRVKDFENLGNGNISKGLPPLPDVMSAGFTTLRNILGSNARR